MNIENYDKNGTLLQIECIGYKKAFMGDKMYFYKVVIKGFEYLLVDAGMIMLLDMMWTAENKFVNATFSNDELEEFEKILKKVPKSVIELENDKGEYKFFTQNVIKPVIAKPTPKRVKGCYSDDEANELFRFIKEFMVFLKEHRFQKIKQRDIDQNPELLEGLLDYEVKYHTDGDHKNDGQMVEYTFVFKSPKGVQTSISTEMCLMVGWNHCTDIKIK